MYLEVIGADGRMKIEPLSGYPVIRDLMVDYSKFEDNRIKAKALDDLKPQRRSISNQRNCRWSNGI